MVKKSGLGLQDPVTSFNKKYLILLCASSDLIGALKGERAFSTVNHLLVIREERRDGKKSVKNPKTPNSRE